MSSAPEGTVLLTAQLAACPVEHIEEYAFPFILRRPDVVKINAILAPDADAKLLRGWTSGQIWSSSGPFTTESHSDSCTLAQEKPAGAPGKGSRSHKAAESAGIGISNRADLARSRRRQWKHCNARFASSVPGSHPRPSLWCDTVLVQCERDTGH